MTMTEEKWLTGKDGVPMLRYICTSQGSLRKKADRRRLKLYNCACARRLLELAPVAPLRQGIEAAEHFADEPEPEKVTLEVCHRFRLRLRDREVREQVPSVLGTQWLELVLWYLFRGKNLRGCARCNARMAAYYLEYANAGFDRLAIKSRPYRQRWQAELLREIYGNPFRPLPVRSFPAEVRGLAQACYDGDREIYPILADALEEMGEDVAAEHCRRPEHVRGCHVVDWVLGRG